MSAIPQLSADGKYYSFQVRGANGRAREITAFRRKDNGPWTIKPRGGGRPRWKSLQVCGSAPLDLRIVRARAQQFVRRIANESRAVIPEALPQREFVEIPLRYNGAPSLLVALIDRDCATMVGDYVWYAKANKQTGLIYAYTTGGLAMHQLICPTAEGQQVDHANGVTLDNRRANLRPATRSQNLRNRRFKVHGLQPDGTTRYRGVTQASEFKYRADITIGTFSTPEEAALAYNRVATFIAGPFAVLNLLPAGANPKARPRRRNFQSKSPQQSVPNALKITEMEVGCRTRREGDLRPTK